MYCSITVTVGAVQWWRAVRSECCFSVQDAVVGTSQLVLSCHSPGLSPAPGGHQGPPAVQDGVHEGVQPPQQPGAGEHQ